MARRRALRFESILESHEQKCMYDLFEIVDEYFDAVDNSKEPAVEEFDKKTSFAKMAQPRFRQRATSAIFSATPEGADSSKSPVSARLHARARVRVGYGVHMTSNRGIGRCPSVPPGLQ